MHRASSGTTVSPTRGLGCPVPSDHLRRGYVRVSIGAPEENRRCVESLRRTLDRRTPRPAAH